MKNLLSLSDTANLKSLREVNVLIKISQSIISTLDYHRILQIISDGMAELLEIETAAVYLLEKDEKIYLSATTPPLDPNMPDALKRASVLDHPHIQKAISERKVQIIADTKTCKLSPAEQFVVDMRQLRSLLYFPFIQENVVLGVLILGTCNKSRVYDEHEVVLGQTIANQLSISIQNSFLHEDLRKHKDNLELLVQEKTKDLDAAIEELRGANESLYDQNEIINNQNTELLATLQHLKNTQAHLLQAEKMASLGTLTAGVAHEINNPLNFLMGAYYNLDNYFKKDGLRDKEEVSVFLDVIKTGIDRISNITGSLNKFSSDSTNMNEDCNIRSIIENCLFIINFQIKQKAEVTTSYFDENYSCKGNGSKLHQAFLHILTNAVQSIEKSGNIAISTKSDKSGKNVIIEFSDNGIGIDIENIPRITDPFFTTKDPGKGIGLGLSITYNIINEHQGSLEFDSKPGIGTTARVILPLK